MTPKTRRRVRARQRRAAATRWSAACCPIDVSQSVSYFTVSRDGAVLAVGGINDIRGPWWLLMEGRSA